LTPPILPIVDEIADHDDDGEDPGELQDRGSDVLGDGLRHRKDRPEGIADRDREREADQMHDDQIPDQPGDDHQQDNDSV
jgi:hypothetical protein